MSDPNQDPYGSIFNIDMYPNLSADFRFDQPDDLYQQQLVQLPHQKIPQQQVIQLPQQPVPPDHQHQQLYTPVNLLSFQPLPPDPNAALLYPPVQSSLIASTASVILSEPLMMSAPVMSTSVLSQQDQPHLKEQLISTAFNASGVHQQTSSDLILGPGMTTPPPLSHLQAGDANSSNPFTTIASAPSTSIRAKEPKKRKPRTPKTHQSSGQGAMANPIDHPAHPGGSFKDIRGFVLRLMEKQTEHFADRDFAERALLNLSRKIASRPNVLAEWEKAIVNSDPNTGCVTVPRPKDGRMTVTKTSGGSTCKKVFPQILVCQVFRWPKIVFHNDIKSSETCQHPGAVKPPNLLISQPGSSNNDNPGKDDSDGSIGGDVICINPFHYVITPEAEIRFRKANARTENAISKQTKLVASPAKQGPVLNVPVFFSTTQPVLPVPDLMTSMEEDEISSGDDAESSDEVSSTKSDDNEIDYIKMWEDEAVETNQGIPTVQEFDEEKLLGEIKFLSFDEEKKLFLPTDKDILEKLDVKKEIKNLLFSGKLMDNLCKSQKIIFSQIQNQSQHLPHLMSEKEDKKAKTVDDKLTEVENPVNEIQMATIQKIDHASTKSDRDIASFEMSPEEDNSIRDLLADIQDSYVRQLDEEFHEMSSSPSNVAEFVTNGNNESSNVASFFNSSDDPDEGSNLLEIDPNAAADDDLPCIVNAWTMPNDHSNSNEGEEDNLIEGSASISQADFDNLFSDDQSSQSYQAMEEQEDGNIYQDFHGHNYQPF